MSTRGTASAVPLSVCANGSLADDEAAAAAAAAAASAMAELAATRVGDGDDRFGTIGSVLDNFHAAVRHEPTSSKAWHRWAMANFNVVAQLSAMAKADGGAAAAIADAADVRRCVMVVDDTPAFSSELQHQEELSGGGDGSGRDGGGGGGGDAANGGGDGDSSAVTWLRALLSANFFVVLAAVSYAMFGMGTADTIYKSVLSVFEPRANAAAVAESRVHGLVDDGHYVHRSDVARELQHWMALDMPNTLVLYGPRGSGKSTAVLNGLANHTGVLRVYLTPAATQLSCAIVRALKLTEGNKPYPCTRLEQLKPVFDAARRRMPNDTLPVVIMEVSGVGEAVEVLAQDALRQAKKLLFDFKMARGVLVLCDAALAFALNEDQRRRTMLWVDDFTRDEASAYLDSYDVLTGVNDTALRTQLFDAVGTRGAALQQFVGMYRSSPDEQGVHKFIKLVRKQACSLMLWWESAQAAHAVLHRLANSTSGAVAIENEKGEKEMEEGDLLRVIKKYGHLVMYHNDIIRAYSPAHLRAIRRWHAALPCMDDEA
mmetsp:Transcript_36739/g.89892  ORF Transcript_36739/g.89892 Transcript_36739/m.89892 type:complete len:543 (+) Transcript_36739:30-1658(+)